MVARRRVGRKGAKGPRRGPKRVARKSKGGDGIATDKGQYATIRESTVFSDVQGNMAYNFNFNLSQFQRASALAPNFKWYKATHVEWIVEPLFNTFQDSAGSSTIPYMVQTMNRTQDTTGVNYGDLLAMGCKPKKLTSPVKTKYTPNWCSPGLQTQVIDLGATSTAISLGLKAQYSWLPCPDTNPGLNVVSTLIPAAPAAQPMAPIAANMVIYNGHSVYFDQEIDAIVDQNLARVTCNVIWAFKGPHYTTAVKLNNVAPKLE